MKYVETILEMWFVIFFMLWNLHRLPCSEVIDQATQTGIFIDEYCPKMKYCAEGAHTMCMFYNPSHPYGPRCSNYQNISISFGVADTLLDLVNEMRGQIAMGKETGQGNITLPRAYGMYKLKWDNELATFAQVLANTCVLRNDLCRATKRFEAPGQLASLVRFTIPDWLPVVHRQTFTEKGLIPSKVEYAAKEACKSWYQQKQFVTLAMLKSTPDWYAQPSRTQGKTYLQLIDGSATHMGCGVSGYAEYYYHGNDIIYNIIEVICNFSTAPRKGTQVYRMTNSDDGCGCPHNIASDDRCLCTDPIPKVLDRSCGKDKNCKPAVVLLPIFTVEDVPDNKLIRKGRRTNMECKHCSKKYSPYPEFKASDLEVQEDSHGDHNESDVTARRKYKKTYLGFDDFSTTSPPANDLDNRGDNDYDDVEEIKQEPSSIVVHSLEYPYSTQRVPKASGHRYGRKGVRSNRFHNRNIGHTVNSIKDRFSRRSKGAMRKKSIFSRGPKFELPGALNRLRPNTRKDAAVKPDVTPRRFSDIKNVLDSYLSNKKKGTFPNIVAEVNITKPVVKPRFKADKSKLSRNKTGFLITKIDKAIKPAKERIKEKNPEIVPAKTTLGSTLSVNETSTHSYQKEETLQTLDVNYINEDSDTKLMTLLDNLEQEVKHIELDKNEKEIFDVKIRKIYDTVVGKAPKTTVKSNIDEEEHKLRDNILKSEIYDEDILNDDEIIENTNKKGEDKIMTDTEDRVTKLHSKRRDSRNKIAKLSLFNSKKYPKSIYAQPDIGSAETRLVERKSGYMNLRDDFEENNDIEFKKIKSSNFNNLGDENDYDKDVDVSKEIVGSDNQVQSVPLKIQRPEKESAPLQYMRKEKEIDKPRIHLQNKDVEKRNQINQRTNQQKKLRNHDRNQRRPNMHYIGMGKRSENRLDDDNGRNLNSIDEPKVRYEEDIRDYNLPDRPKKYFDDDDMLKKSYDYDKEDEDDPLGEERRKFYQEKLNSLRRQSQKPNGNRYRNKHEIMARQRHLNRLQKIQTRQREERLSADRLGRERQRQNRLGLDRISTRQSGSRYYVPDRARALHSF